MADSKTIEPWFDFDAMEWLREPQKLLTEEDSARLIAAAPDLLEALKDAEELLGAFLMDQNPVRVAARAAISKAEGC